MSPTHTRFGAEGAGWPSKRLGAARGRVGIDGARHERAGLLGAQAMRFQYAPNAPTAHAAAVGLHLGAEPARAIALAVARKRLTISGLLSRLGHGVVLLPALCVVRAGRCRGKCSRGRLVEDDQGFF